MADDFIDAEIIESSPTRNKKQLNISLSATIAFSIVFLFLSMSFGEALSDENNVSLNNSLFSGVEVTFTALSLFVMVPVLSSAARIPLPLEIILMAILLSCDISI